MEQEICINEYVRTENGYIGRLLSFDKDKDFFGEIECNFIIGGLPIKEEDIVKHSKNIIDLIEVRRLCEWL